MGRLGKSLSPLYLCTARLFERKPFASAHCTINNSRTLLSFPYSALGRIVLTAKCTLCFLFFQRTYCYLCASLGKKKKERMRTWRGDKDIGWPAIERDLMPCKLCPTCGCIKLKTSFTDTEFKRRDDNNEKVGICRLCQSLQRREGPAFTMYLLLFLSCRDRFPSKRKAFYLEL